MADWSGTVVSITRERKLINMRDCTGKELERLVPARVLSLEQALEFCADGECVKVTHRLTFVGTRTITDSHRALRCAGCPGFLAGTPSYGRPRYFTRFLPTFRV